MSVEEMILIVEDDRHISELLEFNLLKQGYRVLTSETGTEGLRLASEKNPSLVVLDVMLPQMDGVSVLRKLRESEKTRRLPVLMLTAKTDESDILVGLELGADDYMAKPFSVKEVVARIRAILRRSSGSGDDTAKSQKISLGPIVMDVDNHEIFLDGAPLTLTLAEFRIVQSLVGKPGRVFTREELIGHMTGGDVVLVDRNIDVHIRSIRKKFDQHADLIVTIRGVGYKCKG